MYIFLKVNVHNTKPFSKCIRMNTRYKYKYKSNKMTTIENTNHTSIQLSPKKATRVAFHPSIKASNKPITRWSAHSS